MHFSWSPSVLPQSNHTRNRRIIHQQCSSIFSSLSTFCLESCGTLACQTSCYFCFSLLLIRRGAENHLPSKSEIFAAVDGSPYAMASCNNLRLTFHSWASTISLFVKCIRQESDRYDLLTSTGNFVCHNINHLFGLILGFSLLKM